MFIGGGALTLLELKMGCLKKICLALACYCVSYAATVNNPIIWADVPDVSVMRVDDTYYMVSTTMHFAPGVPIMASKNLAEWRTIGYAYQTLTNNNKQNLDAGENAYGKGSWASSIRYNKGYFYVLTPSYTTGKTHLYKTKDIENGSWSEITLPFYHDPSLFFDDDGSVFVIYGSGDISYVELNSDVSGVKAGGKSGKLSGVNIDAVTGASGYIVKQEGAQIVKVNGEYYLFTISWPNGKCRTEIVYRSKTLLGNYTGRIFLQNNGVAQGGIFDTPDGKWYAMLFRDSGPVGRVPYLAPISWENGWPVIDNGKAPATLDLPANVLPGYGMVTSDDFNSDKLPLEWQWNHNPDNANWSLTANQGHLRITTSRVDSKLYTAKNTLTQRTFGPKCVGRIFLDAFGMNDGDIAGLVALQDSMGYVGIKKSGNNYSAVMYHGTREVATKQLSSSKAYFRIDFDLPIDHGTATFYYSENGTTWTSIGDKLNLSYTLGMFTGYRFGLFNYATKQAGGFVDFDWFKIGENEKDEIYLQAQDTTPPTPFNNIVAILPGKIEAENYNEGKRAYFDKDLENQGKAYRDDAVDIVTIDGNEEGYAIGYTQEGEWLTYSVNVKESSDYEVRVNMATNSENAGVKLYIDSVQITDNIFAIKGENWNTYSETSAKILNLEKGFHTLKMEIVGNYVNVDYIEFCAGLCKTTKILRQLNFTKNANKNYKIFSLSGEFIGNINAINLNDAYKKTLEKFPKNMYLIK